MDLHASYTLDGPLFRRVHKDKPPKPIFIGNHVLIPGKPGFITSLARLNENRDYTWKANHALFSDEVRIDQLKPLVGSLKENLVGGDGDEVEGQGDGEDGNDVGGQGDGEDGGEGGDGEDGKDDDDDKKGGDGDDGRSTIRPTEPIDPDDVVVAPESIRTVTPKDMQTQYSYPGRDYRFVQDSKHYISQQGQQDYIDDYVDMQTMTIDEEAEAEFNRFLENSKKPDDFKTIRLDAKDQFGQSVDAVSEVKMLEWLNEQYKQFIISKTPDPSDPSEPIGEGGTIYVEDEKGIRTYYTKTSNLYNGAIQNFWNRLPTKRIGNYTLEDFTTYSKLQPDFEVLLHRNFGGKKYYDVDQVDELFEKQFRRFIRYMQGHDGL